MYLVTEKVHMMKSRTQRVSERMMLLLTFFQNVSNFVIHGALPENVYSRQRNWSKRVEYKPLPDETQLLSQLHVALRLEVELWRRA